MICYWLTLIALVIHAAELGVARHRSALALGALVAAILTAALEYLIGHTPAGGLGVACGVVTILGLRWLGRWLVDGGLLLLAQLGAELVRVAVPAVAGFLIDVVARIAEVFSPAPAPVTVVVEQSLPVSRDWSHRYATAQEMRWSGPGETALLSGETTGDTAGETVTGPALTLVETYWDWLPGSVQKAGGYNAAAREAKRLFDVSRAKFGRDLRDLREGQEAAA